MTTGTIRLHRVLRAKPERIYKAFLNAEAMAKWLPPYGFTCTVHHMDARVGGTFRMSFTNFTTGNGHSFGGEYLELVPSQKISYSDKFDDPNLPGVMKTTVTLTPRAEPRSPSCRKGCPRRSRSRCAISAGKSRSRNWRTSSSRRYRIEVNQG